MSAIAASNERKERRRRAYIDRIPGSSGSIPSGLALPRIRTTSWVVGVCRSAARHQGGAGLADLARIVTVVVTLLLSVT